jgi:hypothetical protein
MLDIPSRNVVWVSNSKELIYLHVKRLWPMPDWCISGTAWPMHLQRLLRDSNDQHISRFGPFCFQPCMPFEVSDYSFKNQLLWNYMYGQFILFRSTCRLHEVQTIHLTDVVSVGCGPNISIQCKNHFKRNFMLLFVYVVQLKFKFWTNVALIRIR